MPRLYWTGVSFHFFRALRSARTFSVRLRCSVPEENEKLLPASESFSKPYLMTPLLGIVIALLLGGCSIIGEERMHYMKKDWDRIKGPVWSDAGERIGFDEVLPTAKQKEAANEKQICLHGNGRNRVTTQDGVNDKVDYRNCVLAPYQTDAGSRMGNRPDGVGSVVN